MNEIKFYKDTNGNIDIIYFSKQAKYRFKKINMKELKNNEFEIQLISIYINDIKFFWEPLDEYQIFFNDGLKKRIKSIKQCLDEIKDENISPSEKEYFDTKYGIHISFLVGSDRKKYINTLKKIFHRINIEYPEIFE